MKFTLLLFLICQHKKQFENGAMHKFIIPFHYDVQKWKVSSIQMKNPANRKSLIEQLNNATQHGNIVVVKIQFRICS